MVVQSIVKGCMLIGERPFTNPDITLPAGKRSGMVKGSAPPDCYANVLHGLDWSGNLRYGVHGLQSLGE